MVKKMSQSKGKGNGKAKRAHEAKRKGVRSGVAEARRKAFASDDVRAHGTHEVQSAKDGNGDRAPGCESSRCAVSHACGACSWIDVPYDEQLARKDAFVAELFSDDIFSSAEIRQTIGMDDPFHYRNKVTSPFAPGKRMAREGESSRAKRSSQSGRDSRQRGRAEAPRYEILTGMYAAGTHHLVATDGCLIENERAHEVIRAIKSIMGTYHIAPYDEDSGKGFIRHAIVRVGHESGEMLVTLVTNDEAFPNSKSFCRELVRRCPFVTTVVQNVNLRQTNVILGQKESRLYGPGFILDTLCGLSFRISSQSFYQVNAVQTAILYEQAIELAALDGTQTIIDAYCGTGTIGLVAAKRGARRVIGVDSVEAAIRDARENARHNGVENAEFVAADAGDYLRGVAEAGESVDVVLMDPPRAGSTEQFLDAVAELSPARVVYVSCNPKTQVRDARYLAERGFSLDVVQPVDMFPHTAHVESVALMSRGESSH